MRARIFLLAALSAACRDGPAAPAEPKPAMPDSINLAGIDTGMLRAIVTTPMVILVPTRDSTGKLIPYDEGGGEAVHPSVACEDFAKSKCRMMMGPYPGSNSRLENPSVLTMVDSTHWVEGSGAKNPILPPPTKSGWINNSDPDLNYDRASGRYFFTNRAVSWDSNVVSVFGSANAVEWDGKGPIVSLTSHMIVSQSYTMGHDGVPRLYYVNSGRGGCSSPENHVEVRKAVNFTSGIMLEDLRFGSPETVSFNQAGFLAWHPEIRFVPELGLYVGLIAAYPLNSSCGNSELFLTTSEDGISFRTYPHPLLWRTNPWIRAAAIYRSSFIFSQSDRKLHVWLSIYDMHSEWHLWYMAADWGLLIKRLETLRQSAGFASLAYARFTQPDSARDRVLRNFVAP